MNTPVALPVSMTTERRRTLALLDAIDAGEPVTQRNLSRRLGMALGLTNSFLKRLIRKGYVKITTIPGRRLLYALTPKGATEKIRLTYDYIHVSFGLYRDVVSRLEHAFQEMERRDHLRAAFVGTPEMYEIADLVARRGRVRLSDGPVRLPLTGPPPPSRPRPPARTQVVLVATWRPDARTLYDLGRRYPGRSFVILFPDPGEDPVQAHEPRYDWSPS